MTKQSKDNANRSLLETTRAAARHGLLAEPVGAIRRWDFTTLTGKLVGLYWPRQRTAWTRERLGESRRLDGRPSTHRAHWVRHELRKPSVAWTVTRRGKLGKAR
jgi:hypothetical protein